MTTPDQDTPPPMYGHGRLRFVSAIFCLVFFVVALRVTDLSIINAQGPHAAAGQKSQNKPPAYARQRGQIVDRNGTVLAISLRTAGLFADTTHVHDPEYLAAKLAEIVPTIDYKRTLDKLSLGRKFVWIARRVTPLQQQSILQLGEPGLRFKTGYSRIYPHGNLASHVLGFVDDDNKGLGGLESAYNEELQNDQSVLELTIDIRIQHAVKDELEQAMQHTGASAAVGIVADARSGALLGMVSLPDFDPNRPAAGDQEAKFNRATLANYEPGSTFKIFNTAMALEYKVATLGTMYDATKPLRISRYRINDYHAKNRWLDVSEAFIYSSNIASARMADQVGGDRQKAFLKNIGMLDAIALDLPERVRPLAPQKWRRISTMTIGYGHGLSVSPIHIVSGVAAMVNGGHMITPHLLGVHYRDGTPVATDTPSGKKVVSEETSAIMRKLMWLNAQAGSGRGANVAGYLVGGKTGTAEKNSDGQYDKDLLVSSFVAAFPLNAPQYVVYVMLDQPQRVAVDDPRRPTGGVVAAPLAGRIITRIAPLLALPPLHSDLQSAEDSLALPAFTRKKFIAF